MVCKTIIKWNTKDKELPYSGINQLFEILCYSGMKILKGRVRDSYVGKEAYIVQRSILMECLRKRYDLFDTRMDNRGGNADANDDRNRRSG